MLTLAAVAWIFASASSSGTTAPVILVVIALVGSGGLGYFLDRRSTQASRLAQDAVSATDVFQASLAEARTKRTELEAELIKVKADLAVAIAKQAADTVKLDHLRRRVAELEAELAAAEAKLAELERRTAPPK